MHVALVHIARGVDGTPVSPAVDHLGMGILAAFLRRNGHAVSIFDTTASPCGSNELLTQIMDCDPDLAGFSLNYINAAESIAMATDLKRHKPKLLLCAGGLYATFHCEALLRHGLDLVVLGEGEQPLLCLAEQGGHALKKEHIPGLAWLLKGIPRHTHPGPGLPFEKLPWPARDTLDALSRLPRGCRKAAVEASRGCRHSCRFCSIAAAQRLCYAPGVRRVRAPGEVAREIGDIITNFSINDFWFMDADFLGGRNELRRQLEIAEAIAALGRPLTFEMDTRADAVTPEAIAALKRAGLERVFLGVESFDQETLDMFGKGAKVETNLRAVAVLQEAGVRPILGSIMFHPRSTLAQLRTEHEALSIIGYEKTQMLFRLKKYRGSSDAGDMDCDGRGVSFYENYGWQFDDPLIDLAWSIFNRARLRLMDAVFVELTSAFKRGQVEVSAFSQRTDRIFNALGQCMTHVLKTLERPGASRLTDEKTGLLLEMDELVAGLLLERT